MCAKARRSAALCTLYAHYANSNTAVTHSQTADEGACGCSLKSANILLDRQHRAKLADVGLAKTLSNMHAGTLATMMATAELGTFSWAAPEVRLLLWQVQSVKARRGCLRQPHGVWACFVSTAEVGQDCHLGKACRQQAVELSMFPRLLLNALSKLPWYTARSQQPAPHGTGCCHECE